MPRLLGETAQGGRGAVDAPGLFFDTSVLVAAAVAGHADDLLATDRSWLLQQWQQALLLGEGSLLVIVTPENFAAFSADPRGFLRRVAGG